MPEYTVYLDSHIMTVRQVEADSIQDAKAKALADTPSVNGRDYDPAGEWAATEIETGGETVWTEPNPLAAVYALADRWEGRPAMADRAFATELLAVLPPRTTTDR